MNFTFEDILTKTLRLSFSHEDLKACQLLLNINKKHGLDLILKNGVSLESMMEDGILQLDSLSLNSNFCFVNLPADKYVFDGHPFKVAKYASKYNENSFTETAIKSKLLVNLISINDQYRSLGLLKGETNSYVSFD